MSFLAPGNVDPGRLDRRVSLQYPVETRTAQGVSTTTWYEVASVWASKLVPSGARMYAAEAKNALDVVGWRIRWRPDVTQFWRLVHGDDVYEIIPPVVEVGRRHFLDLACRAVNQTASSSILVVDLESDDTSLRFQLTDPTRNTAVDLTSLEAVSFIVKLSPSTLDADAVIRKTLAAGLAEVVDATGVLSSGVYSQLEVHFSSADLDQLTDATPFFMELKLTISGVTRTYAQGFLTRRPPPN